MTHVTLTQLNSAASRRRPPRRLELFGQLPEGRTADAMDDRQAAEELMDDLLALLDAGLVAAVDDHGAVRYAMTDPDDIVA